MKKIYFIGLGLSLALMGIRMGFMHEFLTVRGIIIEFILTLLFAHIYLATTYAGMSLVRVIYQSWFEELKIIGFWVSTIGATLTLMYLYVVGFTMSEASFFFLNGLPMLITGCAMEYYHQNVIEFKVDKNIKEIKDEDFKIKL